MLDLMQRLYSQKLSVQEARMPIEGSVEFWHCSILDEKKFPVSGGFGANRDLARKIAIAEFLERMSYQRIASNIDLHKSWGIDQVSTGCGFAVGFNKENTIIRSVAEAYERWVLSKWIDEDYLIDEVSQDSIYCSLDPASQFFANQFDNVAFFKKPLLIPLSGKILNFETAVTVGLKDKGAFIGSTTRIAGGNVWQHPLLESYRHLLGYRNNPKRDDIFPSNRINFFATNAESALQQIRRSKKVQWPTPKIQLHRCEHFVDDNYYLARTIVEGWISWNLGPLDRFLY